RTRERSPATRHRARTTAPRRISPPRWQHPETAREPRRTGAPASSRETFPVAWCVLLGANYRKRSTLPLPLFGSFSSWLKNGPIGLPANKTARRTSADYSSSTMAVRPIAMFREDFLPFSQTFVFEEIRLLTRHRVEVFAWQRLNETLFP